MLFEKPCGSSDAATFAETSPTPPMHKEVLEVTGQCAKTLAALVKAGAAGVTALECGAWAFRLADYVHRLRRDQGLIIETCREAHEGGWHARYVLRTPVALVKLD